MRSDVAQHALRVVTSVHGKQNLHMHLHVGWNAAMVPALESSTLDRRQGRGLWFHAWPRRHLAEDGGHRPALPRRLSAIVVKRELTPLRRSKHLCADAGYRSAENIRIIEEHGYIAHVVA